MIIMAQQSAPAAEAAESLGGWYFGLILGFFLVWVVVILVAMILTYAGRINRQARQATQALDVSRQNTLPLWNIEGLNDHARAVLESAQTIRFQVFGEEA